MGVYIKGMEMPTSCRACLYSRTDIRNVDWCVLTEKDLPCDCPLVEIPPHGRLGDLDALIDKVIAKYLENERKGELVFAAAEIKQDIVDLISDAPTIFPASFENLPKSKDSQKIEEGE